MIEIPFITSEYDYLGSYNAHTSHFHSVYLEMNGILQLKDEQFDKNKY